MSSLIKIRREELQLSTTQFAYLLGVQQSTAVRLEQSEANAAITVSSLKKAAAALGCKFEYRLVPLTEKSANQTIHEPSSSVSKKTAKSKLAEQMKGEEIKLAKKMTPEQRLKRALELSDFTKKFSLCSKKS